MTTIAAPSVTTRPVARAPGTGPRWAIQDTLTITWRNLLA